MRSLYPRQVTPQRSGYTLVEIIMAIVVVSILLSIAFVAYRAVSESAKEVSIILEMREIEAAVERFKVRYGFYPPTFGLAIKNPRDLNRYLIKIAPNHAEGDGSPGTPLANWWDAVGSKLHSRNSLVFWLSGMCQSETYPLSGSAALAKEGTLAPIDVEYFSDGRVIPAPPKRIVLYHFNRGQIFYNLIADQSKIPVGYWQSPTQKGDGIYRYYDHASYVSKGAYTASGTYLNPDSCQLFCPGMDGVLGNPLENDITKLGSEHLDNIVNFANGRLERVVD